MPKPADSSTAPSSPSSSAAGRAAGERSLPPPRLDLRDPVLAGIMAWLIPGAGHWYQGRRTKAVLFFVCILGAFSYGLWLGGGRVVYAAWGPTPDEKRLPYFCQIGVGIPALPALYQAQRFKNKKFADQAVQRVTNKEATLMDWFMAPPQQIGGDDELDRLNYELNRRFELGTVYTMVAGLLNLLVIFDALGGPALGLRSRVAVEKPEPREAAATTTAD